MSSTNQKSYPTASTKVGDPVNAILNQARSTLNQSRQFRDSSAISASRPQVDPRALQSIVSSGSRIDGNQQKPKGQKKVSIATFDTSKKTSTETLFKDDLIRRSKSNNEPKKQPSRSSLKGQGQGQTDPPTAGIGTTAPQQVGQSSKQSATTYDYDTILANAKVPKRGGRSDFNIFKVGQRANPSMSSINKFDIGNDVGKPPPTPPDKGKRFYQRSGGFINPNKSRKNDYDDREEDSESESDGSTSTAYDDTSTNTSSDDDDSETDDDSHTEDSTSITPPTITESKSLSNPNNKNQGIQETPTSGRPMSLKAITLDGENHYGSNSRGATARKITIQDLRDRPVVFSSQESHAVVKAMSPDRDEDFDSYARQYDNPTPKSYTEDFVSEIQSIADDFSKSFARSVSQSGADTSIEVPKTENSTEVPSTEVSDNMKSASSKNGHTARRKKSHKNAASSLKIVNEIKGNLQDLQILDIVDSFEVEKAAAAAALAKSNNVNADDDYPDDLIIGGSGKNDNTSSSVSGSENTKTNSTSKPISNKIPESRKQRVQSTSSASNDRAGKLTSSHNKRVTNSAKAVPSPSDKAKGTTQIPPQKKVQQPQKAPSQVELTLSRASSRKNFQATLSQVKLHDGVVPPTVGLLREEEPFAKNTELQEKARKLEILEQKYPYKTPKTKPQTQIHSILEKEVYRKELSRLRKEHRREEKELRIINEARSKNYQKVQEIMEKKGKSGYRQPSLNFPLEVETDPSTAGNWGAPYFNLDGTLNQAYGYANLPRTPEENENIDNYAAHVGTMNVPQLVREVMKSNERMYKMTVKAAKEMGKEYAKNVKGSRKIRDMQPLVKD